jgi:hypothetical protein
VQAPQYVGDLDDSAVPVGRQFLPERHRPPADRDGLLDAVEGAHGGDGVLGEPSGNPHFLCRGGELAGPCDAHDHPPGKRKIAFSPSRIGSTPAGSNPTQAHAAAKDVPERRYAARGAHEARTAVRIRWRSSTTAHLGVRVRVAGQLAQVVGGPPGAQRPSRVHRLDPDGWPPRPDHR